MPWIGGLAVANKWLTPLQANFLTRFFATDTGQLFFLTGGTALAAYYLHHRLSVDLDLFTLDDLALRETDVLIPQLAIKLGCRIGRARRSEFFHPPGRPVARPVAPTGELSLSPQPLPTPRVKQMQPLLIETQRYKITNSHLHLNPYSDHAGGFTETSANDLGTLSH